MDIQWNRENCLDRKGNKEARDKLKLTKRINEKLQKKKTRQFKNVSVVSKSIITKIIILEEMLRGLGMGVEEK